MLNKTEIKNGLFILDFGKADFNLSDIVDMEQYLLDKNKKQYIYFYNKFNLINLS